MVTTYYVNIFRQRDGINHFSGVVLYRNREEAESQPATKEPSYVCTVQIEVEDKGNKNV